MCIECKLCGHVNSIDRVYCEECSNKIQWRKKTKKNNKK